MPKRNPPAARPSEWLERAADLDPVEVSTPAAEAVRDARTERERELAERRDEPPSRELTRGPVS